MKNFLVSHLTQIATYATIIVIFTHNVLFDRDMVCTCKDQTFHCITYIGVPIFIIFFLLLWKDKNFNGACRACCCMKTRSEANFCCIIFLQMGKAIVIGLLWVVSVLFDGDWYACCRNDLKGEEAQIPCKTSRSLDEQATIDHLKNKSKSWGLWILLGFLSLVVCFSLLKWCKKCKDCSSCSDNCCKDCSSCSDNCWKDCSSCSDGDAPYELIIIQEEENIVNQILKERAKEALTQKVKEILEKDKTYNYMNCYDAAQQVINQEWPEVNQGPGAVGEAPPAGQGPSPSGDQSKASPSNQEKKGETSRNEDDGGSSAGGTAPEPDQGPGEGDEASEPDQMELEQLIQD